jgi:hypothetical protein
VDRGAYELNSSVAPETDSQSQGFQNYGCLIILAIVDSIGFYNVDTKEKKARATIYLLE